MGKKREISRTLLLFLTKECRFEGDEKAELYYKGTCGSEEK
ncbi:MULTISPECIES: hypothetical protein [Tissierella]|nr:MULTISPECIES: hypothetical protein [Tissierella]WFA09189.1 hypothetical protein P3962_01050 [Tissierella sp. Yu-01]